VSTVNPDYIRQVLEAKRDELLSSTSGRNEILIEKVADEFETMQQQLNREVAISNLDRESKLLKAIGAAIARLADGTFGLCLHCDEPISEKRLRAIPWAGYCVSCQETIDRQHSKNEAADMQDTIDRAA
jgi:DnaK suppressor protein